MLQDKLKIAAGVVLAIALSVSVFVYKKMDHTSRGYLQGTSREYYVTIRELKEDKTLWPFPD